MGNGLLEQVMSGSSEGWNEECQRCQQGGKMRKEKGPGHTVCRQSQTTYETNFTP